MLRSRALRSIAIAATAAFSVSCGDASSTSPDVGARAKLVAPATAAFTALSGQAKAKAVRWGASHVQVEERATSVIGPSGGVLSLPGSDFEMAIPEGALSAPTAITVISKGGAHVAYDMQPHGLVFQKPVTVVQRLNRTAPYGTAEANGIRSAYLADGNERIDLDDTATPAELEAGSTVFAGPENTAQTHIWYLQHFSRYILISGILMLVEEQE